VACIGFALSCLVIYQGQKEALPSKPVILPPSPPYESFIAGQGIIESAYKNIPIGSSYSDIITEVYVYVGQRVPKGAPLFKTDTRHFEAQLVQAAQQLALAQEEYRNQEIQFSYYAQLADKNAVSKQAYTTAEYNKKIAAQAVNVARATMELYATDIERSIVRAPIDGQVLESNVRVGQYATQSSGSEDALILFGNTRDLHVRIDILLDQPIKNLRYVCPSDIL